MTTTTLHRLLSRATRCDMNVHSTLSSDNGWKISIQGKSIEDSIFLFERLSSFLMDGNIPFKVGTAKRFSLDQSEQSKKAMTIYCPDGFNFANLCEDVYSLILDYKGWYNITTPTSYSHYAGGLFIRNDRDASGVYLKAS